MVTQTDIDNLQCDLQELRTLLMTKRERVRPRLDALMDQTENLQAQAATSDYAPTIHNVHELLLAFRRGFEVGDAVRKMRR